MVALRRPDVRSVRSRTPTLATIADACGQHMDLATPAPETGSYACETVPRDLARGCRTAATKACRARNNSDRLAVR